VTGGGGPAARKELDSLAHQLEAQVQENEKLSRLNREQEEWLLALEQAEDGKKDMKTPKDDHTISQQTLVDPVFKELLALLQNDIKLTITLQSKQHVKKRLTKNLGQLQENLDQLKALELKSQEAPGLQSKACPTSSRLWWPINAT
jgi:hypothetical protein